MPAADTVTPPVLQYGVRLPQAESPIHPTLPAMLAIPPVICWVLLAKILLAHKIPYSGWFVPLALVWTVTLGVSAWTVQHYKCEDRRHPWYVHLCVYGSWSWLLFTISPMGMMLGMFLVTLIWNGG